MKETEQDRSIRRGNVYFVESVVLTCGALFEHVQQPHHSNVLSKLSGNNTLLNNYDVTEIHCTAPSKMKLIYVI